VTGDVTGLPIPSDADALREGGTRLLTDAFHRFDALAPDNRVVGITGFAEVDGGSTGRKLLLSVDYLVPGPHQDLFVKFSRDLSDPERDRGRTQMKPEVAFAALARGDGFPVTVPTVLFADYHDASGTGVLITERIPFGANGIEAQYAKCMDYEMPDQLGHYRALLSAVARLAGTDRSGAIPHRLTADMEELSVGERPALDANRLLRRVERLADFATTHPGLLPDNLRSPAFHTDLAAVLPGLLERESAVWEELRTSPDLEALCHWNANVDNAWFWRDGAGDLQCGLMDWGCVGRMNVAMAIWGAMCSAETDLWDHHLGELLTCFADEYHRSGGPVLDVNLLTRHVLLYASVMGMTWLLDVPAYVRSQVPEATASTTRFSPGVADVESVRCRLQMMTNVLNLWATCDFGALTVA
jgi:hypothetical protein